MKHFGNATGKACLMYAGPTEVVKHISASTRGSQLYLKMK